MEIGFVGLGKMGGNMVRRLLKQGVSVVAWDLQETAMAEVKAAGAALASGLEDLVAQLGSREGRAHARAVWLMVPAGTIVDQSIASLLPHLAPGDIIIDGGNSNWKDSRRRGEELAAQGIEFVDCGTSGGVWGLANGYCLMYGGSEAAVRVLAPVFDALAPSAEDSVSSSHPVSGHLHCGPVGSGHFVKMVHNGIEYGMMQAYAEGFELLEKSPFEIDTAAVANVWREGSVVRSWLLDLIARALEENRPLDGIAPWVADSGEGRWTVEAGVELGVPVPVISQALFTRFASRNTDSYALKLLAAMRDQFGGHGMRKNP
jgi:6-phosphogluconate dehydrogenase